MSKTKAAQHATEQADEAASVYGTPGAAELAGKDAGDAYSLQDLLQEGSADIARAHKHLPPLDGRPQREWQDELGIHSNPDPSYVDERDQQGLPPMEVRARIEERTALLKEDVSAVGKEMDRLARVRANKPLIEALQNVTTRREWEAGQREQSEAQAAEVARLAGLASEGIPASQEEFANRSYAALLHYHRDAMEGASHDDISRASMAAVERYKREHPGAQATPRKLAQLTAAELSGDDGDGEHDNSRTAGLGAGDTSLPAAHSAKSKERDEPDMFDDLQAIQKKMNLY